MKNHSSNLKAFLSILLIFGVSLTGASCSQNTYLKKSPSSNSAIEQISSNSLSSLTEYIGATSQFSTSIGFYEVIFCPTGGVNISYTDYETLSSIMLCSRVECLHNDDTCTSWFPSSTGAVFMSADEKSLFFIQHSTTDTKKGSCIWLLKPNGTDRKIIGEFSPQETIMDMIIGDSNNLYIDISGVDKASGESYKELRCISIQNTKTEKIISLEETDCLVGAYDNILVFCSNDNQIITYWTFPINNVQQQTIVLQYPNPEKAEIEWAFCINDQIVTCSPKAETRADLQVLNLKDKSENPFGEVPYFGRDTTFPLGVVDNQLFVQTTDTRKKDVNNIIVYYYAINLATGEVTLAPLRTVESINKPVYVVNSYSNSYHVMIGDKKTKALLIGNDGTYFESEIYSPKYALMSKKDFWNGTPNFIDIK